MNVASFVRFWIRTSGPKSCVIPLISLCESRFIDSEKIILKSRTRGHRNSYDRASSFNVEPQLFNRCSGLDDFCFSEAAFLSESSPSITPSLFSRCIFNDAVSNRRLKSRLRRPKSFEQLPKNFYGRNEGSKILASLIRMSIRKPDLVKLGLFSLWFCVN